jgi:hypothetical protein
MVRMTTDFHHCMHTPASCLEPKAAYAKAVNLDSNEGDRRPEVERKIVV